MGQGPGTQAARELRPSVDNLGRSMETAAQTGGEAIQRATRDVSRTVEQVGMHTVDAAGRAVSRVADSFDGLTDVGREGVRTVEKVGIHTVDKTESMVSRITDTLNGVTAASERVLTLVGGRGTQVVSTLGRLASSTWYKAVDQTTGEIGETTRFTVSEVCYFFREVLPHLERVSVTLCACFVVVVFLVLWFLTEALSIMATSGHLRVNPCVVGVVLTTVLVAVSTPRLVRGHVNTNSSSFLQELELLSQDTLNPKSPGSAGSDRDEKQLLLGRVNDFLARIGNSNVALRGPDLEKVSLLVQFAARAVQPPAILPTEASTTFPDMPESPCAPSEQASASVASPASAGTPSKQAQPAARPLWNQVEEQPEDQSETPQVWRLKKKTTFEEGPPTRAKVVDVGEAGPEGQTRAWLTIVLLGATGSGKSTWLNALVNYVAGVLWVDEYRFRLVEESVDCSQAFSQTKVITLYRIHWQPGFKVPYNLMVVDTPGYGDTDGLLRDKLITKQFSRFLGGAAEAAGVSTLTAICLVGKASDQRLTAAQKHIFSSILSLFGQDMEDNIIVLGTHADAGKAGIREALTEEKVPYTEVLKFNNSALYAQNKADANSEFNFFFWKMGLVGFATFFDVVGAMEPKPLVNTKQVLHDREAIETYVEYIQECVRAALAKSEEIRQEFRLVRDNKTLIDSNKDFEYTVMEENLEKVDTPVGYHVTNCLRCNRTCHDGCGIAKDEDKSGCIAMGSDGNCKNCAGKCHWTQHFNNPYKFETRQKPVRRTYSEMKARYEQALKKKLDHEGMLAALEEDYVMYQVAIIQNTKEIHGCLERLRELALREDPLSHSDYIELLISSEIMDAKPGWQARVAHLRQALEQVKRLKEVVEGKMCVPDIQELRRELEKQPAASSSSASSGDSRWSGLLSSAREFLGL